MLGDLLGVDGLGACALDDVARRRTLSSPPVADDDLQGLADDEAHVERERRARGLAGVRASGSIRERGVAHAEHPVPGGDRALDGNGRPRPAGAPAC